MRWRENALHADIAMPRWRELAKRYVREINRACRPTLNLEGDRLSWVTA
jgi:hypothetical protein